jgi:hypothetical protein
MLALQPVSYGILFLLSILSLASQTLAALPLSNQHAEQNLKVRQGTAIASGDSPLLLLSYPSSLFKLTSSFSD